MKIAAKDEPLACYAMFAKGHPTPGQYRSLAPTAVDEKSPMLKLRPGDKLDFGGCRFRVVSRTVRPVEDFDDGVIWFECVP